VLIIIVYLFPRSRRRALVALPDISLSLGAFDLRGSLVPLLTLDRYMAVYNNFFPGKDSYFTLHIQVPRLYQTIVSFVRKCYYSPSTRILCPYHRLFQGRSLVAAAARPHNHTRLIRRRAHRFAGRRKPRDSHRCGSSVWLRIQFGRTHGGNGEATVRYLKDPNPHD